MKSPASTIVGLAALWQFSFATAIAQPSVYSGVFTLNEGDLSNQTKQQTITNFVADAQKDVSIINFFIAWASGSSTNATAAFPSTGMSYIRNHGSIPLLTWEPWNPSQGVVQSFTLANITNGVYDPYIKAWAGAARTWGQPFFLRFGHEMNGNWYPWCASVNGNTPTQYVKAWQHVHDLFLSAGATNVTWIWCVNVVSGSTTPISQLYPGDNYVDWIAVDGYNRLANPWQDFSAIMAPTITQLTSLVPGKPIMVSETGCNQNTSFNKAQWFLNALTNYLPTVQPRIKAWVYFNSTNSSDGNDWRITSPASAVTGYRQGIGLSYYATNQYGQISGTPIQPLLNDVTPTDTMAPFISIISPATVLATNGTVVPLVALASDKSGVNRVVFSLNGVPQQTNASPPYLFLWNVSGSGSQTVTVAATAYGNSGNSAASTVQFTTQNPVQVTLIASDAPGSSSFDAAGNWDSGQPPATGSDYFVGSGYTLRTPTNSLSYVFAGNSLTIAGALAFTTTNVITIDNLHITNGNLVTMAADATLAGSPVVQGSLTFGGGNFLVDGDVTLAGSSGASSLNVNGGRFAVAGNIADGGGAGSLNLNGGVVDLQPSGEFAAGSVSVNSLSLNGIIANALDIMAVHLSGNGSISNQTGVTTVTGTASPGDYNTLGTLTAGSLMLLGSTAMKLNRTNAPGSDQFVANSISLGGTLMVTNTGDPLQAGDTFTLFSGTISGAFAATNLPPLPSPDLYWDTSLLSGGIIKVAIVPPLPVRITNWAINGTTFTLQTDSSQTNYYYILQSTLTLCPPAWTDIQTNAGGGLISFTVPIDSNTQQFFRISER
jgi:beta-mannanase